MRTRTMWATVPLLVFFTCQMMGQSKAMNWLDCSTEAFVQQICYFQVRFTTQVIALVTAIDAGCTAFRPIYGRRRRYSPQTAS